jgi:hypothetical protein
LPQSSSASRFTAGASGFFILSQSARAVPVAPSLKLARSALGWRKEKEDTINRFAELCGGGRITSQVCSYDMHTCHLAIRCGHKGAGRQFELNRAVMDASGRNAIEINKWSTLGAELGKLCRLHRADCGIVNHGMTSAIVADRMLSWF